MSPERLLRASGFLAIAGGILLALAESVESLFFAMAKDESFSHHELAHPNLALVEAVSLVYVTLLLLGLIGLHVRQSERAGAFGIVSFGLAIIGCILSLGALWAGTLLLPSAAHAAPEWLDGLLTKEPLAVRLMMMLSFFGFGVGLFLYGIATVRAKVYPRWMGALMCCVVGMPFLPAIPALLTGAAFVFMGRELLRSQSRQPAPAGSEPTE